MIAKNFQRNPDALIAQRELELVFATPQDVSAEALTTIRATFNAAGQWLRSYAKKATKAAAAMPQWFAAMRRRAVALAKAVKAACLPLIA